MVTQTVVLVTYLISKQVQHSPPFPCFCCRELLLLFFQIVCRFNSLVAQISETTQVKKRKVGTTVGLFGSFQDKHHIVPSLFLHPTTQVYYVCLANLLHSQVVWSSPRTSLLSSAASPACPMILHGYSIWFRPFCLRSPCNVRQW